MNIKKFFSWVAWFIEKDCNRAAVYFYPVTIVFGGILYLIMRVGVRINFQDALKISIITSVSVVEVIILIASCFFSGPKVGVEQGKEQ